MVQVVQQCSEKVQSVDQSVLKHRAVVPKYKDVSVPQVKGLGKVKANAYSKREMDKEGLFSVHKLSKWSE